MVKKWIVIIFLISLIGFAIIFYFQRKEIDTDFLDKPVILTVYAYSIDGLGVVPAYQDPERLVVEKRNTKRIPDELFQRFLREKEKIMVVDSIEVFTERDNLIQFYLVKTGDGKYAYIPNYRVVGGEGKPLGIPPQKGTRY
jgi:hypothetical protein